MDPILQRFIQAEQDFLIAATTGNQILSDFAERWQTLQSDWESCFHEADHNTQQLVAKIVTKVEELAGDIYLVESHAMSLKDDLLASIEDLFASLSLEDEIPQADPEAGNSTAPSAGHCAISPTEWLLNNLHNPYPLPHIRFSNGQTPGSKLTKDWFAKARQRIGWTRLLRDRFAGCRSLAIEAAFRAFVRDDPHNPLDADMKTAFLAIKSHAELVYRDEAAASQPSPKRPRSISPTPSLTFSSSSEDSDDERYPPPSSDATFTRPLKRASPETHDSPSPKRRRARPSPYSTTVQVNHSASLVYAETPSPRQRKRRLSEGDSYCPRPKRPRGMECDRSHAVSDPLPKPTNLTWFDFDQPFQFPNPASTDPLEMSSFDLDFFEPPSLHASVVPPTPINTASADVTGSPGDFSALFEMPQLDLLQSALPTFTSDWTEFLNFEPDFSPFPSSPSLLSSSTSTPSLIDDAALSLPSPLYDGPSSPKSLLHILPHLSDKETPLPIVGEPAIQGQDFLLPPGEDAGIPSFATLLSVL